MTPKLRRHVDFSSQGTWPTARPLRWRGRADFGKHLIVRGDQEGTPKPNLAQETGQVSTELTHAYPLGLWCLLFVLGRLHDASRL
jgi:hypothetical protein